MTSGQHSWRSWRRHDDRPSGGRCRGHHGHQLAVRRSAKPTGRPTGGVPDPEGVNRHEHSVHQATAPTAPTKHCGDPSADLLLRHGRRSGRAAGRPTGRRLSTGPLLGPAWRWPSRSAWPSSPSTSASPGLRRLLRRHRPRPRRPGAWRASLPHPQRGPTPNRWRAVTTRPTSLPMRDRRASDISSSVSGPTAGESPALLWPRRSHPARRTGVRNSLGRPLGSR